MPKTKVAKVYENHIKVINISISFTLFVGVVIMMELKSEDEWQFSWRFYCIGLFSRLIVFLGRWVHQSRNVGKFAKKKWSKTPADFDSKSDQVEWRSRWFQQILVPVLIITGIFLTEILMPFSYDIKMYNNFSASFISFVLIS